MSGSKRWGLLKEAWTALKFVLDPGVPISEKIWVIISLFYFISPVDFIPDPIFGIGILDDLVVILLMLSFMAGRLKKYEESQDIYSRAKKKTDERDVIDVEYEVIDNKKGE
ncbi:MAG: hypothetical protein PWQ97_543 [Tepidanaerobacteraceae bacterium]|nr:hypothetical protein [Tepidanaerobacteraceae bacterium]